MSFLKIERKPSGTYLRIAESYRDEQGKTRHKLLHSLGRVEDYTAEQLRHMGLRMYELGGGQIKALLKGEVQEMGRFNYGYIQIYNKALAHYGLDRTLAHIGMRYGLSFDLTNAVKLMLMERLQSPCSKRSNYIHQTDYIGLEPVYLQHLYRALDKLAIHNESIQRQIFQTGRDLFSGQLDVVFYDVTTLYFESDKEFDVENKELRKKGFSKDGKIGDTQILFCMLIDKDKNPIGYQIYKGDMFEGHTLPLAIEQLKTKYAIDKVIMVADRGMMSEDNLAAITQNGFEFIVGERLKNLPRNVQSFLLDMNNYQHEWTYVDEDGQPVNLRYGVMQHGERTIIVTYSHKRAKKDLHEREQKLITAEILLKQPSLIKRKATHYFLKQQGDQHYELDNEKINQASRYDGILAISTNTTNLTHLQVLEQYKQLFKIEHTFRSFKSHLETRPMFHWTDRRIQGHICLCYIAYTLLHWVLQKLQSMTIPISENILRQMLDKMQVSLIQNNDNKLYLRSADQPHEVKLQQCLGLKPLPPLLGESHLAKYL